MPRSVLIVIESPLLTRFVRNVFLQHYPGAEVYSARRAHEGASLALHKQPEAIILDHNLSDLGSVAFANLLAGGSASRKIPIVLAHRASEMPNVDEFPQPNLVSMLPKPFAPEFLIAAIAEAIASSRVPEPAKSTILSNGADSEDQHETALAPPMPPSNASMLRVVKPRARLTPQSTNPSNSQAASVLFRGNTESFPLPSALAAIEDDHLTGVLRLFSGKMPTEVYFSEGHILMATTRDTVRYAEEMAGANAILAAQGIGMAHEIQRSNGCPVYLTLAKQQVIKREHAIDEARLQSVRLVARAWDGDRTAYEFERLPLLPDYLAGIEPVDEPTYQWALAALRCLDGDNQRVRRRLEAAGVPAYTPEGYELIQKLRLTTGEAAFASAVNNSSTVDAIAELVKMPARQAIRELHKFILLEIMDYWPPRVLAGE